jgi:hypothetical protein
MNHITRVQRYLSAMQIYCFNGINSITDDRKAENPPYVTECLFNGQTNDFIIHANGNFWGENPEYHYQKGSALLM